MQLIVAEKPSVARDLARVLGVRVGGKHSFEGNGRVITWCIGHLVELEEPAAYDGRWKSWRLDTLPMLPAEFRLRGAKHARQQLTEVSKLLRDRAITSVVNACDAGREGELIFRYVYQHARSKLPVQRLWISSLTDEAIRRGFAALRPGRDFEPLADAARSRSEADWLVGMNATRAVTVRGRETGHTNLMSIGRVQTPTLAMLVERERAIRAFVPRDYWEVRAELTAVGGERFTAQWRRGKVTRFASLALADAVVARDEERGDARDARGPRVIKVDARTVKEPAPLLFDLTSLQRTAHRRFGFSAARTLELAQALYERHKLLTYPRTDSRHLTNDVLAELPAVLDALESRPEYAAIAAAARTRPPLGKRFVDDSKVHDHHAIIPTPKHGSSSHGDSLGADERKLFDLVSRRFLAAYFPDAEIAATEVWIRVGEGTVVTELRDPAAKDEPDAMLTALPPLPDLYVARGRVRMVAGWQDVAGIDAKSATRGKEGEETVPGLPVLTVGDALDGRFAAKAKQTTPPPRYTEATLLGAMESAGKAITDEELRAAMKDCGLGTPATRASIIETLLHREFVVRQKQELVPTPTGMALIAALPVASLASPELTGTWEARLARIARGEDSRAAFMADIAEYVSRVVGAIRGGAPPPPAPSSPPPAPPSPPPAPSSPSRPSSGPPVSPLAMQGRALGRERGRKPSRTQKAERKAPKPGPALTAELRCPRCERGLLLTGSRGWGCSRWREGCRFVVWFETAGKKLTTKQLEDLVTTGKTRKGTFHDRGMRLSGRVVLDSSTENGTRFQPE